MSAEALGAGADVRAPLRDARRVVVKVGSRTLVEDPRRFVALAAELAALRQAGRAVVLVSSGAIALGVAALELGARPRKMARLQAAAAVGQSRLLRHWEEALAAHGLAAAQLLLTHADLADRDRYLNARAALGALLELGAVPVINENDTVAVDEIRFGDNDQLAAMVATLVGADCLVLLTDVEGLLDDAGARVPVVTDPAAAQALVRAPSAPGVGSGGMGSKVEAARRATRYGVPVVVAPAVHPQVLAAVFAGADVGTLFLPLGTPLASRKHWIAYTRKPAGALLLDAGAAQAIAGGASLLAAGVLGARGSFQPGDAVKLLGPGGAEVGRGLVRYDVSDAARLAGARTDDVEARLGRPGSGVLVHADDLVAVSGTAQSDPSSASGA
ncbi:MAG: glutamate 5-kinase [Myxococcota bacterium]